MSERQPDPDKVICPSCCHQFRAIPVNVQAEVEALSLEVSELTNACRRLQAEVEALRRAKDGAYLERNQCVALIARLHVALGHSVTVTKTAIEGWSEDWHGCVYVQMPTGQASWHFHDSHAYLFADLPHGECQWDGHDTDEKYRRVALAARPGGEK